MPTSPPAAPSTHAGMGARPVDGAVAFRVWAPHADAVHVTGSFNDWSGDAHPLAPEDGGVWSADVPEAAPGDEYKFVLTCGEERYDRIDPYAREVTSSVGNAVVVDPAFEWQDEGFALPPWNELVLYEMHIGTFNDAPGGAPGTLDKAAERLDYLRDLGVNAVELMPLAEFAGDYSWGYNTAHPFAVESAYGGPRALKRFVDEAHRRGIGVLLDVVYNHFGPSDLDLWRFDGWGEGDYGGIYFFQDERAVTPWGNTRPDYGREEVRRFIRDNALFWLEAYHLDGLRWDGTVFIRDVSFFRDRPIPEGWALMQRVNDEARAARPGVLMIAEDLQNDAALTRATDDGGAGFGMQWDAGFVHPVREALIPPDDEARDLDAVRRALEHRYNLDAFERVIYTESHDEVANGCARVPHEIDAEDAASWAAQKRSTLGAALVFTAPGVPMIFQGQEVLEDEWFCDTEPVDWGLLAARRGIHALYRDLIRLRLGGDGTTRGLTGQHVAVIRLDAEAGVLAYRRWRDGGAGDETVVVLNFKNRTHDAYRIGLPAPGTWRVRLNSDAAAYSDAFADHPSLDLDAEDSPLDDLPASGAVSIGAYTAVVLSQDGEG